MRLVGPNCLGVMSPISGLNATFAAGMARPGRVAFISQSGALRSIMPLALPHERAGLMSAFYVLSYLAFSLPAIPARSSTDTHTTLHL